MNGTPTAFGIKVDMGVSHLSDVTCSTGGGPDRVFQDGEVQGAVYAARQDRPSQNVAFMSWYALHCGS